jgi:ADP-dependent NAD(P)H-hydrate dehydratase
MRMGMHNDFDYRESRKKVLIVGGSMIYHGAPILSALSAEVSSLTAAVYVAVPRLNADVTRRLLINSVVLPLPDQQLTSKSVAHLLHILLPETPDIAAIGMGMNLSNLRALTDLVDELTERKTRIVLDASALVPEILGTISQTGTIVTPHAGEYKRLFQEAAGDLIDEMRSNVLRLAKDYGITIVLKGQINVISDGDRITTIPRSTPAMTVGGTGDVLTGLIAGLLTQIKSEFQSSSLAVYLNGLAAMRARRIGLHMIATDLLEELPKVLQDYDKRCILKGADRKTSMNIDPCS